MKLTSADAPKLLAIENEIINALKVHNALSPETTEAMIGVVACVRIARQLLNQYDERTQQQHLVPLVAFLQGQAAPAADNGLIVLPPHFGPFGNGGR